MPDQEKNEATEEELELAWQETREGDMKRIKNWKVSYTFPDPFLQGDLAKYQTRLKKIGGTGDTAIAIYRGLVVRVAIDLGWITGIDNVDKLIPGKINFISGRVFDDIVYANRIPNE